MTSIKITDSMIYNYASNPSAYQRGISYFNQGRVFDFYFNENDFTVNASVEGNDSFYDASITFAEQGGIVSSSCECPAFDSYPGACKHIVAVLKEAQRNLRYIHKSPARSNNSINQIFSYFNSFFEEQKKEVCSLEITLHVEKESDHLVKFLELRVGTGRLYIVKDIKEFLLDLNNFRPVEFGKSFNFDPSQHAFSEVDLEFLNMLQEILDNEDVGYSKHSYFSEPVSAYKGKKVYLSDPYIRKMFTVVQGRSIHAVVLGAPHYNVTVVESNLPIELTLQQEQDEIRLGYTNNLRMIPLTKSGDYFFLENAIYHPSSVQTKNFAPFYQAFTESPQSYISISKADIGRFVSEVLPFLHNAAKVVIDSSLVENFHKEDLLIKIYFDKYEEGISARLEFHYGSEVVIPFTPRSEIRSEDKILIRAPEEERRILDFFEKYEFKVEKEKIYLRNEEKIFEFIYNALPSLKEMAEIYYSDSFRNLKVTNGFGLSGGIKLTDNSLLEFTFNFEGIDPAELSFILSSLREKRRYYRLKDGSFIPLDVPELQSIAQLVEQLNISAQDLDSKLIHLPKYRAMYIDNLLRESNLNGIERNLAFKQMVQNVKEPQDMEFIVPSALKNILRDYQKTGFKWLKTLSTYGFGGILADDMGLGKTLQVITFVLSERLETAKPALVIAPTSLVYNWQEEVRKFMPSMKVAVVSGIQKERVEQFKEINDADIVVTSYALIRRDIEMYNEYEFSYCILDEAQHIKNPNTINARSVKQIKAKGYFALTGTPIENSLTELWSIFDFIMPGYLLSYGQFTKKFESPIIKSQDENALKDLGNHIKPFILRRMKKDVLKELPEKIEGKMTCEMTDTQKKVYMAYLNKAKGEIASELAVNGFKKSQIKILAILTRLRQICCHPSLFLENYEGESGKLSLLLEILEDGIGSGHRVLLFSQFTSMLQLIAKELEKQNIDYFYLDGSTKVEIRRDMVKGFNDGQRKVFLISLKAGGTGLNLTGADMVIHFDPWWNPAVEDQASDRAYRIGQNNVVQVIRLITQSTIEEKIYALQQKKRAMIDAVIQPGETLLTKMTEAEILQLFEL